MQLKNTTQAYGLISKSLHWLIAALILFLIGLGWFMVDLGYYDPRSQSSLHWHRSLGLLALLLALVALAWRSVSRPPPYEQNLPRWQRVAASSAHGLLFLLMLLLPLSGYLISTSAGEAIPLFSGIALPAFFNISQTLRDWAIDSHYYLAYGGLGLIVLHAAAALKHHFIDRDNTLKKML
jgi:cytochrome b561